MLSTGILAQSPKQSKRIFQQPAQTEIERRDNNIPQSNKTRTQTKSTSAASNETKTHPPLRFVFSGYSLWLELEQQDIDNNGQGDLDRAMIDAADRFHLGGAIPSPHVTALYGIDTISEEDEMRRVFREDVKRILLEDAEKRRRRKLWPDLAAWGPMFPFNE